MIKVRLTMGIASKKKKKRLSLLFLNPVPIFSIVAFA